MRIIQQRLLRFTVPTTLALCVGAMASCSGNGPTGPDGPVPLSKFTAMFLFSLPVAEGQIAMTYFDNPTYVATASAEVYPLRRTRIEVRRGPGDSLYVNGWIREESETFGCQINLSALLPPAALDGRSVPVSLNSDFRGKMYLWPTCNRPDSPFGLGYLYTTVDSSDARVKFVPTADSAGRLDISLSLAGAVRFDENLPDTALTYFIRAEGRFERRRDGSQYANGEYIRGGPRDPTQSSPPPTVPLAPGSVTCPNPPVGYACVTRNGIQTPLKQSPQGVALGWFHSSSYQTCIGLGTPLATLASYRAGPGYGGVPITGIGSWGAMVNSAGVITGTADGRYIYIYTGHPDPQVALLLYDKQRGTFATMGFQRVSSCPY